MMGVCGVSNSGRLLKTKIQIDGNVVDCFGNKEKIKSIVQGMQFCLILVQPSKFNNNNTPIDEANAT